MAKDVKVQLAETTDAREAESLADGSDNEASQMHCSSTSCHCDLRCNAISIIAASAQVRSNKHAHAGNGAPGGKHGKLV